MKNIENPLSHVSKPEINMENPICPSCLMDRQADETECKYCGVIFAKYLKWSKEKRTKLTISGLYHLSIADIESLQAAWDKIENNYLIQDNHDRFIHQCLRLKSLPFAAYSYNRRLEIFPEDDIARLQLEKVMTLARDWFALDKEQMVEFPYNRGLMRVTAALSVFGIIAGILTLFTGLLTSDRGFFMLCGVFMMAAFTFVFAMSKRLAAAS